LASSAIKSSIYGTAATKNLALGTPSAYVKACAGESKVSTSFSVDKKPFCLIKLDFPKGTPPRSSKRTLYDCDTVAANGQPVVPSPTTI
jgi:hypothetical protein